jgi:hypothetical protein
VARKAVWRPQLASVDWRVHTLTASGASGDAGAADSSGEPAVVLRLGVAQPVRGKAAAAGGPAEVIEVALSKPALGSALAALDALERELQANA